MVSINNGICRFLSMPWVLSRVIISAPACGVRSAPRAGNRARRQRRKMLVYAAWAHIYSKCAPPLLVLQITQKQAQRERAARDVMGASAQVNPEESSER